MAKPKPLELPQTPQYQTDPIFQQGNQALLDWGRNLSSGSFGWLNPLLDNTNNALKAAQGTLQPQFRDTLQQIKNQAAGAGNLESSTFTDALARAGSDLNSQYQSIVSQQAIADNNAKLGLFGAGLNTIGQATQFGQNNQNAQNQFNLENYSNQVAQAIQKNQNSKNPGFFGNLLSGFSPFAHDIYSASGYNVPGMGTQQALLTGFNALSGASGGIGGLQGFGGSLTGGFGGNSAVGGLQTSVPGQSASNNPFGLIGKDYGQQYLRY